MNKLDHVVTENINTNTDKLSDNDLKFNTSTLKSSSGSRYPLPVVIVSLQGGKKHRSTTVAGLKCLWDT